MRLLTVALVVAVERACPDPGPWRSVVYALAFAHYAMALLYSRRQAAAVLGDPRGRRRAAALAVLGASLYWGRFPLILYFAAHHAFNEGYLARESDERLAPRELGAIRASAAVLHLFLYAAILRGHVYLSLVPSSLWSLGVAASLALHLGALGPARRSLGPAELLRRATPEVLGLAVLALSLAARVSFLHIICYHVVFWAIHPLRRLRLGPLQRTAAYLGTTAAATAGFLMLAKAASPEGPLAGPWYDSQFLFWSHLHITLSFALSEAHPGWIVRWFRPRPAQEAAFPEPGAAFPEARGINV